MLRWSRGTPRGRLVSVRDVIRGAVAFEDRHATLGTRQAVGHVDRCGTDEAKGDDHQEHRRA